MRAYSMDLRERVWADCQAGMTTPAVAQKYSVSPSWVRRLKQRQKATGSIAPRPPSPGRPVTLAPHDARLRELVRADPDATQEYVLAHAAEMEPRVASQHIELYVNGFTKDLGDTGYAAVEELLRRAADAGLTPPVDRPLRLVNR